MKDEESSQRSLNEFMRIAEKLREKRDPNKPSETGFKLNLMDAMRKLSSLFRKWL